MSRAVVTSQPHGWGFPSSPSSRGTNRTLDADDVQMLSLQDPDLIPDYPKELDLLNGVDFLHVEQQMGKDIKGGCGSNNTYLLKDKRGRKLFYAVEDDNCLCRWCCGPSRMLHVTLYSLVDEALLHFDRTCCRCDWCCCFNCCCCQHSLVIRSGRGHILGYARERFHCFNLKMDVQDTRGEPFLKIRGPCCACRCCTQANFDILSRNGEKELGYIYKRWYGHNPDVNMDHENFDLALPAGLSVLQKSVLLGASFLVNFMYFEMS